MASIAQPKFGAEIAAVHNGLVLAVQWVPAMDAEKQWAGREQRVPSREAVLEALTGITGVGNDQVTVSLTEDLQYPGGCEEISVQGDASGFEAVLVVTGQIVVRLLDAGIIDQAVGSV